METTLEWILTHSYKTHMISYLETHPADFDELIELAIADNQPYSWRAAWLLWSCMEVNDKRIQRHLKRIIETISLKNDDQQRELFIILQKMDIGEELEGSLYNHCVSVWEKAGKKPSVRYNAFKLIIKIAKRHPDLSREIEFLIQDQYVESLSSTVKKSISRMVKEIS